MRFTLLSKQIEFFAKLRFQKRFVFLLGGLGNQLFQYAYAHHIAQLSGKNVILVDATRRLRVPRKFELELLLSHCNHGIRSWSNPLVSFFLAKFLNLESRLSARNQFFRLRRNTPKNFPIFNRGFFQDKELVADISESILIELRQLVSNESDIIDESKKLVRIAAHIRRGDYKANKQGLLSLKYYFEILNHLDFGELIVHTDDTMVKEKIVEKFPNAVVYDSSDATAWDVLTDLANSDVVVAANSTLSWWGAWLCVQNNGLAFLPSIWIRGSGEPPPNVIEGFIIHESVWD